MLYAFKSEANLICWTRQEMPYVTGFLACCQRYLDTIGAFSLIAAHIICELNDGMLVYM